MDIPLPEESQPPGLPDEQVSSFPRCDNIPLPSCGIKFNTTALPPPFPPPALPIAAPILPLEAPPLPQTSDANAEPADDPNRYSPSRATAEDDIPITPPPLPKSESSRAHSFRPKPAVLGKAQAKKRLLAFSMTKQGGGAGLSFGFQKKAVPKVNTGSAKAFVGATVDDEGVQESKDPAVKQEKQPSQVKKKSSKKGLSRDDKARAVVSAIEEIKREELMLRGVIAYGSLDLKTAGDMTAPLPLLAHPLGMPPKPKDDFDLSGNPLLEQQKGAIESLLDSLLSQTDKAHSNDKGALNSEADTDMWRSERHDGGRRKEERKKGSDRGSSSRRRSDGQERRRSKEQHSRSAKDRHKDEKRYRAPPTELPTSWAHFRSGGYRIEEIRRLKLKLDDRDLGGGMSGNHSRDRRHRKSRDRRSRSREDRKPRKSPTNDSAKDSKSEEDLDHLYRPFEGPSRLRFPLVITNSAQMVIEYPRSFVRYTKARPPVSYCENPDSASAHFRSRTEIFDGATSETVMLMKEIISSKQQEEPVKIKEEPGENLSSSLAALQVSYDEAEVGGSPASPENFTDGRRKERSWFPEKDYVLSTEHEGKADILLSETEVVIKSEEDLEVDGENVTEQKLSSDTKDVESENHASHSEQNKEGTPEMQSAVGAVNVPNAERTTVRSKWDSDYEEDIVSTEEPQHDVSAKESSDHEVEETELFVGPDYSIEEIKSSSVEECVKNSDFQGEEHFLPDEERLILGKEEHTKEILEDGRIIIAETKENIDYVDDDGGGGGGGGGWWH